MNELNGVEFVVIRTRICLIQRGIPDDVRGINVDLRICD